MHAGVYPDQRGFSARWARERQFAPQMDAALRQTKYARWQKAVTATMSF
jgi:glycerol kinase